MDSKQLLVEALRLPEHERAALARAAREPRTRGPRWPDAIDSATEPGTVLELEEMVRGTARDAREDVARVEDPRAQALIETRAEALNGLVNACELSKRERSGPGDSRRYSATAGA